MHTTRALWISGKNIIALLAAVLVFFALYLSSLTNYLLFHSLAELSSVLVAMSIFVIAGTRANLWTTTILIYASGQ